MSGSSSTDQVISSLSVEVIREGFMEEGVPGLSPT